MVIFFPAYFDYARRNALNFTHVSDPSSLWLLVRSKLAMCKLLVPKAVLTKYYTHHITESVKGGSLTLNWTSISREDHLRSIIWGKQTCLHLEICSVMLAGIDRRMCLNCFLNVLSFLQWYITKSACKIIPLSLLKPVPEGISSPFLLWKMFCLHPG